MSRTESARRIRRRLALATGSLMAGACALVLAVAVVGSRTLWHQQVDRELEDELATLADDSVAPGWKNLAAEVKRRSEPAPDDRMVYLFANARYERIEGSLPAWPEGLPDESEGVTLPVRWSVSDLSVVRSVRLASTTRRDGLHLAVGRDVHELARFERSLVWAATGALAVALLLAVGGGLAVSHRLLHRVEGMNRTILRILGGQRGERVPRGDGADEFDELAAHFNRLLDENDRLVERMREVTNDVAHDLRTPLARIRGHIEAALAAPDARESEVLEALLTEVNGVLETFNALLRVAQVEARALRDELETLDPAAIVDDVVELYLPAAEEAGLEIETDCEPRLRASADRHLVAQALANLIDNAIKYARDSGPLTIATRRAADRVELSVRDRGRGIPASLRERALQRFGRLDSSRHLPGTGLGLAFVSAVAELHGAALRLEEAEPGLRVVLSLPIAAPVADPGAS